MNNFLTLLDALEAAPADRVFVTEWEDEDERKTLTFGEFRDRSRFQAQLLHAQGLQPGDRVVIVMPQGTAAMAAFVGAMMLGGVPAFLAYPNFKVDPAKYRSGLQGVTANLGAKFVAIDNEFPDEMLGCVSLSGETLVLRTSEGSASPEEFTVPKFGCFPECVAFIQHSAGTTGLQKGVALTHAAVLRQLQHLSQALKIDTESDRIYSWLPLYHDMGLIACFLLPMVCHLPIVMQSPLDWVMHPETMVQIISELQCTLAWMPNFAFQFVPRRSPKDRWKDCNMSSLRALINCSEPVRRSSMSEFQTAFAPIGLRNSALQSCYAMAENVFAVTQSDIDSPLGPRDVWADADQFRTRHLIVPLAPEDPRSICFRSSGRLLPNQELRIVSDTGEPLDDRHVGEILIRSDGLFDGYYNRPDLTANAIIGGWYHTGDLGFSDESELFVVGRKKDLLIVGGENIYPQDIEEIVGSHRSVHDGRVVAMGLYNSELGTDDIIVVAEVFDEAELSKTEQIESEIRSMVIGGLGVAVRMIFLKPPKWIVKSTAGKAARSATRDKLLQEHPQLKMENKEA